MNTPTLFATLEQWAADHYVAFVNRSSGLYMSATVSKDALLTLAERAALAQQPQQTQPPESAPRKPLFAAAVAQRKWDELQAEGYRMQSIAFESPTRAGTIDAWGVVRWTAAPQVQPEPSRALKEMHDKCAADVVRAFGNYGAAPQVQQAAQRQCKLTECQGKPRCGTCVAMDAAYTAPPPAATRQPLAGEALHEAIGSASVDLLDLAKQWADNKIHVYQFTNEADKIVGAAINRSIGAEQEQP